MCKREDAPVSIGVNRLNDTTVTIPGPIVITSEGWVGRFKRVLPNSKGWFPPDVHLLAEIKLLSGPIIYRRPGDYCEIYKRSVAAAKE